MTVRLRKEILETLYKDFKDYNLPRDITFASYLEITQRGPLRRAIKKSYKNWARCMVGLVNAYPDLFTTAKPQEVKEPEPEVSDVLAALAKASVKDEIETTDG